MGTGAGALKMHWLVTGEWSGGHARVEDPAVALSTIDGV